MAGYIGYRDAGKTNEQGLKEDLNRLFTRGISSIDTPTSMKVTQRGSGANMSVDIAIGDAHLPRPDGTYSYWGWTDAVTNQAISASNPSNPRIDVVVAYVDLSVISSASNNNPGALKFTVVAGTPAGSPAVPSSSTIQSTLGATVPWVALANVAVAANATQVVNANITDVRQPVGAKTNLWGGTSNTIGHSVPNVTDDTVALLNATQTLANKTFTSPALNNATDNGTQLSLVRAETFFDFVASGCVWSGDSYGSTLNASMTSGVVYINGKRVAVSSVTGRAFTASKDTYVYVDDTGALTYTAGTNNAASPSLPANSILLAIIVSGANIAAATSVNQGQESMVLPISSSVPYAVTDSLGNLICPRDPNRKVLGFRQTLTTFNNAANSLTDVTGVSCPVIVPSGRKIKLVGYVPYIANASGTSNATEVYVTEGAAVVAFARSNTLTSTNTWVAPAINITSPSAGSHTYKLSTKNDLAANVALTASGAMGLYVLVELA